MLKIFQLTDSLLLDEIHHVPFTDRKVSLADSEQKVIKQTLEIYYIDFITAVKSLQQAIEMKEKLKYAQKKVALAKEKDGRPLYKNVFENTYKKGNYNNLWQNVLTNYKIFQEKSCNKNLPLRDDVFFKFHNSSEDHHKEMIKNVEAIMSNLKNKENRRQNRILAKQGIKFYKSID